MFQSPSCNIGQYLYILANNLHVVSLINIVPKQADENSSGNINVDGANNAVDVALLVNIILIL